ncbi:MAG TPA: acyclic terpene utilization AtuA family protein [Candidatus Dormibacteraeota bacterium]|nr:acyclic terpene utilization AtuA family protein [Candidatus Dormibacteraeota bacterium]
MPGKEHVRAVAASGNLSTGFRAESLRRAVSGGADFIGCDAGSTDAGPYYLGSGQARGPREGVKRNTERILREALAAGIPVIIGSAGYAGGRPHLHWLLEVVREVAKENSWHFKLAGIDSEVDKDALIGALASGEVTPLEPAPPLDEGVVRNAQRFVAMMGVEPFQRALQAGAQVIVAGRSSDIAIYAALPLLRGIPPGVALHAGKMLECGAASVAQRLYADCMAADLDEQGFTVEPPNPAMRCTPQSVAAHGLYENADPFRLVEPGGVLDTSMARYEAVSDRAVRVTGSCFIPSPAYTVRLEGASLVGYRSIAVAGIRDPLVIRQLDSYLSGLRTVLEHKIRDSVNLEPEQYTLTWRVYGRDGTLGKLEPETSLPCHEVGLIIDLVAPTQALAAEMIPLIAHAGLHHPIPEHNGLISNLAFPFSPPGINVGPVYRFCANHVWKLKDPCALFPMTLEDL